VTKYDGSNQHGGTKPLIIFELRYIEYLVGIPHSLPWLYSYSTCSTYWTIKEDRCQWLIENNNSRVWWGNGGHRIVSTWLYQMNLTHLQGRSVHSKLVLMKGDDNSKVIPAYNRRSPKSSETVEIIQSPQHKNGVPLLYLINVAPSTSYSSISFFSDNQLLLISSDKCAYWQWGLSTTRMTWNLRSRSGEVLQPSHVRTQEVFPKRCTCIWDWANDQTLFQGNGLYDSVKPIYGPGIHRRIHDHPFIVCVASNIVDRHDNSLPE